MSNVPAATRCMRVLRYLGRQVEPVPLEAVAREVGLPRSTAYHLINAMIAEGFVVHLEEERRYALGLAAFEVGSGYTRSQPLQRLARRPLVDLVDQVGESGHFVVLHGHDTYYVLEERAVGRPSLVTDVGARLPAHLTASGRAILAALPRAQVRAVYPDRSAFVTRRPGTGPTTLTALTSLLAGVRQRGYATEEGDVTAGLASVATAALDHAGHPVGAFAVTYEQSEVPAHRRDELVQAVMCATRRLERRLGRT